MSDTKCPFCQQEYIIHKDDPYLGQQRCVCRNPNCEFDGWHFPVKLVFELIRTRTELEQSEICCVEWEKQALDYKAENIALSGELERTRTALGIAVDALNAVTATPLNSRVIHDVANDALKQIIPLARELQFAEMPFVVITGSVDELNENIK